MEMKGEVRIAARRNAVWAALNDPTVLQQCIPGCQSLVMHSPTGLSVTLKIRIGPVSMSFPGTITVSNIEAPGRYTLSGESTGAVAGLAKGSTDVTLTEDGEETILAYDATAQIGGKLAQLGSRLVGSSAGKLAEKFFSDFSAAVNASQA